MVYEARGASEFGWYEASLPAKERKQRGHFSTPHALIDQILDACGYTSSADLRHLRLLDPACGSGNFLACAARRLGLAAHTWGLDQEQTLAFIQRNLWGLDPDPVACFLAEMQVRSALEASYGALPGTFPLHIHQADSLALFWQPCVDLLLVNPPYLAARNTDLSHYRRARRRGQADSYLLFLDLALHVVRPGGWVGLVLPDPVLARANAMLERAHLLHEYTLQHIWHLSGVFAAEVGTVVIIAQKIPPRVLHRLSWARTRWRPEQRLLAEPQLARQVGQALLVRQPGAELRYLLNHKQGRVVERLRRALHERARPATGDGWLVPLERLVSIKRGEEIGRASPALRPQALQEDGYPVLRGGVDLRAYARPQSSLWIERAAVRKPLERYLRPKLLIVKSTERLQAALDTRGHVALQTLYLLHLREQDESMDTYYFLLALLNSRLLRAYVYHLHTAYKLVQPQIEQAVLAHLPVPWGKPDARREIAERARALEQVCSEASPGVEWEAYLASLYEAQERAICALYAAVVPEIVVDKGVMFYG